MPGRATIHHQPRATDAPRSLAGAMRRLERVFAARDWTDGAAVTRARRHVRKHAAGIAADTADESTGARLALLLAASELLLATSSELAQDPERCAELLDEIENVTGIAPIELGLAVLRAPELLNVAPPVAVRWQLALLTAVARLRGASLWVREPGEPISCACHVGQPPPAQSARHLAVQVLSGEAPEQSARRTLAAVPVGPAQQPTAALVGYAGSFTPQRRRLLAEAAPLLAAVREREAMLTASAETQRSISQSSERKLARLGFDLHDGPIQEVVLLAEDLRLFREQLGSHELPPREQTLVHGRFEDLEARLRALDAELRRLSNEMNAASVLLSRPFESALRDGIRAFVVRTGIEPRVRITGPTSQISASQQIALLNIAHESLSNIREHAEAGSVAVEVKVDGGVLMRISDDGRGFDLESTMMRTARQGRVGLLGIHERVRLLGGQCRVETRPGGPTVVEVRLELWEPPPEEPANGAAGA